MKETEVVSTKWLENMAFESEINGHKLIIDAKEEVGGQDRGPRPKSLMLAALGGCTSMDVISILKKMRIELRSLNVIVEGELSEEHPRRFQKIHVIYEVEGDNLPMDKIEKAVSLSEEKYCGVSVVYREVMEITSEIRVKE
ncbi:MAG: OsmC family protein [Bacteroidales bacterium]|nr:OsmC family protein [Bacteroidales bacterium]